WEILTAEVQRAQRFRRGFCPKDYSSALSVLGGKKIPKIPFFKKVQQQNERYCPCNSSATLLTLDIPQST
ncbi:MAG TPA: hypothetical protein PLO99_05275, partial [Chitinophagaceae bacterium]|nr:hypothetical protein [Chitinophagaceae bacterium]